MFTRAWVAWTIVGAALLLSRSASGYTISSIVTHGCHESITTDALRRVRADLATAAPLPTSPDERALINDLQFSPAPDMTDLGSATLLMGVRDNDLHGRDSNDLSQLALLHGNPLSQREHCLRQSHDPEPGGSIDALASCRAFVEERIAMAIEGLDADGAPDPANRTSLSLWLSLRRHVDAPLPTYYVRVGQAIHTIEDLFVHTFRTPDLTEATAVVDWIDQDNGDWNEAIDGPQHSTQLDRCEDSDELVTALREAATQAAEGILRATLDPTRTPEQKMADVEALLDQWMGYSPGCDFENQWCSAPQQAYGNRDLIGCDVAASSGGSPGAVVLLTLLMLVTCARRRSRPGAVAIVVASAVAWGAPAHAQEPAAAPVAPVVVAPVEPHREWPPMGGSLSVAGSGTNAAAAAALGFRVRASKHWTFGVDAEWNPWIAVNGTTKMRSGAFNGYGTAILRMPLADQEMFALRATLNLGVTHTLLSLYGVPKGTTGFFGAISPLGLEWRMSRLARLVINPLSFAAPVPQLRGIPFWYPQYRVTIGVEIYSN